MGVPANATRRRIATLVIGCVLLVMTTWLARPLWLGSSPKAAASANPNATTSSSTFAAFKGSFRSPITLLGGVDVDADGGALEASMLRGKVVSSVDGSPVPGAEIVLLHDGVTTSFLSGTHGEVELTAPSDGTWTVLRVAKAGFVPLEPGLTEGRITWEAKRGRVIEDVVLTLDPATEITAIVHDPAGHPVAGAKVTLTDGASYLVLAQLTTDAKGELRFTASTGTVLRADDARYPPAHARVDPRAIWTRRVILRFRAGNAARATLHGRVVDDHAEPVEEARVTLEAEGASSPSEEMTELGVTDASGRFSFTVAAGTRWDLAVLAAGHARAALSGVAPSEAELIVRLGAEGRVDGRVTSATGPPASFTVVVWERQGSLLFSPRAEASFLEGGGEFSIGGLAPGRYAASAVAAGHGPSPRVDFAIDRAGGTASVALELRRAARFSGRVTSDATRRPIASALVSIEGRLGPSGASAVTSVRSDRQGHFELLGMSAGLGSITVFADGHHGRILSGLAAKEGEDVGPIEVALAPVAPGDEPKLELVGIGAILTSNTDVVVVRETFPEGGAARAGLLPGDEIVGVDGQLVRELGFDGAIQAIRGVEGTVVTLTVKTNGLEHGVIVTRSRMRR